MHLYRQNRNRKEGNIRQTKGKKPAPLRQPCEIEIEFVSNVIARLNQRNRLKSKQSLCPAVLRYRKNGRAGPNAYAPFPNKGKEQFPE
ncbi:MAG: hypothetical protein BroJett006_05810 [Betaproteobacteria bacterium]|nr:MAG: hypothetical protein BroJett006_05810 [Betaproteobacteria bacterium]